MKIKLSQGQITLIDKEDYLKIKNFKWYARFDKKKESFYVLSHEKGSMNSILMHRVITNAQKGFMVDHINGNTLDNRKCNLRVCTHQENLRNQGIQTRKNKTSIYKGVSWHKRQKKWNAYIKLSSGLLNLGSFDSEFEASREYNKMAIKYFGEFAVLNI